MARPPNPRPVYLGDCLLDGVEVSAPEGDASPGVPVAVDHLARSTPAGRRLRKLERLLRQQDGLPVSEVVRRCRAAAGGGHAPGDHRTLITVAVIEGAIGAEHVELDQSGRHPVLRRGQRFHPDALHVGLADHAASLHVGAWALLGDPLTLWEPPTAGVDPIGLPIRVLERSVLELRSDPGVFLLELGREIRDHDPVLAARLGDRWLRRQLRASLMLLVDLGWVRSGSASDPLDAPFEVTVLGELGLAMVVTVLTGELPPSFHQLVVERGYLRARGGYVRPQDVPPHIHVN